MVVPPLGVIILRAARRVVSWHSTLPHDSAAIVKPPNVRVEGLLSSSEFGLANDRKWPNSAYRDRLRPTQRRPLPPTPAGTRPALDPLVALLSGALDER